MNYSSCYPKEGEKKGGKEGVKGKKNDKEVWQRRRERKMEKARKEGKNR